MHGQRSNTITLLVMRLLGLEVSLLNLLPFQLRVATCCRLQAVTGKGERAVHGFNQETIPPV